jgi:hypothetical protein
MDRMLDIMKYQCLGLRFLKPRASHARHVVFSDFEKIAIIVGVRDR